MRPSVAHMITAALVLPAFLIAGAAQGLLFVRCGSTLRMSCCCPREEPPPSTALTQPSRQCGEPIVVPSAPAQKLESTRPLAAGPVLVPLLGVSTPAVLTFADEARPPRHLDPPPALSPVLANCALLI